MDWDKLRLKFDNFWYYYKWHTIGAIFLLLTLLVGIISCNRRETADFYLLYVREDTPAAEQCDQLKEWFGSLAEDLDGDGKKTAKVLPVARSNMWNGDDSQALVVNVVSGDSVLYLVTESAYTILHNNEILQDLSFLGESEYLEGDRFLVSDTKLLNQFSSFKGDTEETLYLCLRKVEGTTLEGDKKYEQQERVAISVMKQIIAKAK